MIRASGGLVLADWQWTLDNGAGNTGGHRTWYRDDPDCAGDDDNATYIEYGFYHNIIGGSAGVTTLGDLICGAEPFPEDPLTVVSITAHSRMSFTSNRTGANNAGSAHGFGIHHADGIWDLYGEDHVVPNDGVARNYSSTFDLAALKENDPDLEWEDVKQAVIAGDLTSKHWFQFANINNQSGAVDTLNVYEYWITFEFAEIPDPPTDLVPGDVGSDFIEFIWTPPAAGPDPESYEYRVNGGTPVNVGLATGATASGLSPSTPYTIEVRSVGPGGASTWILIVASTMSALIGPTVCFDMVRGSAIRVTGLDRRGQVPDPVPYAVSKSVVKVSITEVAESGSTEILKNPEEERRLRIVKPTETIRYRVDIEFLRVDPGVYNLVAGVRTVELPPSVLGFGEIPFGVGPFGGEIAEGRVRGFDADTHLAPTAFGLEVWSKLAGQVCVDGERLWGYTLFPYLKGGRISGFAFANGRVSFNLIGAMTRRMPRWGMGPHDIDGPFQRLLTPVSRNTAYRMFTTTGAPPAEVCGVQTTTDVLDNGTASNPMPDPEAPFIVDGGGAETSAYIIDGGRA